MAQQISIVSSPTYGRSTSLHIEVNSFSDFFSLPEESSTINLSNANLLTVLYEYQNQKRLLKPKFTIDNLIANILRLEAEFGNSLRPKQINEQFYALFIPYLINRGLLPSSINCYCQALVAALNWSTDYGCIKSPTYKNFEIPKFRKTMIALTPDDVSRIYHFDIDAAFAKNHKGKKTKSNHLRNLHRVRDQFVLSCNLGQRISDMTRITPDCFSEDKSTFRIVQQKTGNKAIVDLKTMTIDRKVTKEILERYNYTSPYTGTTSNYDKYLHELMKMIFKDSTETVITEYKMLGEVHKLEIPKWKSIASHTARRTFATYHTNRGISEAIIRKSTGHSDSKSFCKYIDYGND